MVKSSLKRLWCAINCMEYDKDKAAEYALALLFLTMEGDGYNTRAWKTLEWELLETLHQKGYILDPKNKTKSVLVTPEGARRAEELFLKFFRKDKIDEIELVPEIELERLVTGHGLCIASHKITMEGLPVGYMYRKEPHNEFDSGWCFFSGFEDDEYMKDENNHGVFEVNSIVHCDPEIIPFLDSEIGTAFERTGPTDKLTKIVDWKLSED